MFLKAHHFPKFCETSSTLFTYHFHGPGRVIGLMCVRVCMCLDGNFRTKLPMTDTWLAGLS